VLTSHITLGILFGFFHSFWSYLGLYPVHFVSSPFVTLLTRLVNSHDGMVVNVGLIIITLYALIQSICLKVQSVQEISMVDTKIFFVMWLR